MYKLPVDLLEFIAKSITKIKDLNKYRLLSSLLYYIVDNVESYDIELKVVQRVYQSESIICDYAKLEHFKQFKVKFYIQGRFINFYPLTSLRYSV